MADTKCCLGLSNVRNGAWLISIIDMIICIVLIMMSLPLILDYEHHSIGHHNLHKTRIMDSDFITFMAFFILFLFFYANVHLKKATYVHLAQNINQWLVINTIFFVTYFLFVCFCLLKYGLSDIITATIPIGIFLAYQIHVVKCFYNDELKFLMTSEQIATQPTNGPQYIAITSQTVPSSHYPVQTGPYIIQQVQQPTVQATPYPQQIFSFQPQQQPSQSHSVPQNTNIPQEYNNPPPYSPNYAKPDGSIPTQ